MYPASGTGLDLVSAVRAKRTVNDANIFKFIVYTERMSWVSKSHGNGVPETFTRWYNVPPTFGSGVDSG